MWRHLSQWHHSWVRQAAPGAPATFSGAGGIQNGLNVLAVRLLNNSRSLPAGQIGLLFKLQTSYSSLRPFVAAPPTALVNQPVTYTMDALALNGQEPYSYTIDFGDGSSAAYQAGASFTHAYTATGVYTATVMGRDRSGCTGANPLVVTVQPADGNLLANRAAVGYADAAGAAYRGEAGAGILIVPDLAVSKYATPDPAVAGESLTYTLLVTNAGTIRAKCRGDGCTAGRSRASSPLHRLQPQRRHRQLFAGGTYGMPATTRTITLTVRVNPTASGVISNGATVTRRQSRPGAGQ